MTRLLLGYGNIYQELGLTKKGVDLKPIPFLLKLQFNVLLNLIQLV